MRCNSMEYVNFRNIRSEKVCFSDGINVLWGKNAQGKSNILEGIYLFARGRSFRGAKDKEMILFGEDFSRLSMECRRDNLERHTELEIIIGRDGGKKKVYKSKAPLSGITELIGNFRAVLFCPAHLSLVSGAPAGRRSFLDIAISQLSPVYLEELSKYNRVLLQRNAALKNASKGENVPFALWETYGEQMAASASVIASYRYEYMSMLSEEMNLLFNEMTNGKELPSLTYSSHVIKCGEKSGENDGEEESEKGEIEAERISSFGQLKLSSDNLREKLVGDIEREIRYGATLWGIHKDDVRIRLNAKDARLYCSQGQMRSLALTMKLAEGELSRKIGGEKPVILLDDVLSELDSERRDFVLGALSDRQIIVTSCEPSLFERADSGVNLIKVDGGKITEG